MHKYFIFLSVIIFLNLSFAETTEVCFSNATEHEQKKSTLDPAIQKFPMYLIGSALGSNIIAGLKIVVDPVSKKIVLMGNTWQLTESVAFAEKFVKKACVVSESICVLGACRDTSKTIVITLENQTTHRVEIKEPKEITNKDGTKTIIPQLTYISKKNIDLALTNQAGYENQNKKIEKADTNYKEDQQKRAQAGAGQ